MKKWPQCGDLLNAFHFKPIVSGHKLWQSFDWQRLSSILQGCITQVWLCRRENRKEWKERKRGHQSPSAKKVTKIPVCHFDNSGHQLIIQHTCIIDAGKSSDQEGRDLRNNAWQLVVEQISAVHDTHYTKHTTTSTHIHKNNKGCPGWASLCVGDLSTQLWALNFCFSRKDHSLNPSSKFCCL